MKSKIISIISCAILFVSITATAISDTAPESFPAGLSNVQHWPYVGISNLLGFVKADWAPYNGQSKKFVCTDIQKSNCKKYSYCEGDCFVQYSNTSDILGCYSELYTSLSNNYPELLNPWYGYQQVQSIVDTLALPTETPEMEIKILIFQNVE